MAPDILFGQPPIQTNQNKYRNFNLLSIDYAIWPRLRYRLTRRGRTYRRKPWVFSAPDSHWCCTLLKPTFSLPNAPPHLTVQLHCIWNAPLPLAQSANLKLRHLV